MDLKALVAKHGIKIDGVLHVGAHEGEEAEEYFALGVGQVWWVEANPAVLPLLRRKLGGYEGHHVIEGLVYSEVGVQLPFNITNYNGMSSSIFEFGTHPEFSPDTKFVDRITLTSTTIDQMVTEHGIAANFLNMDLQGAELHALLGAVNLLPSIDAVYCEVNKAQVYKGCAQIEDLDSVLASFGLKRVETHWVLTTLSRSRGKKDDGWGDALYIRSGR